MRVKVAWAGLRFVSLSRDSDSYLSESLESLEVTQASCGSVGLGRLGVTGLEYRTAGSGRDTMTEAGHSACQYSSPMQCQ